MKFFKIQSKDTTTNEKILLINKKIEEIYKGPLQDGSLYYKIDVFSRDPTRKYSLVGMHSLRKKSPKSPKMTRSASFYDIKRIPIIKLSNFHSLNNKINSTPKSRSIDKEILIN